MTHNPTTRPHELDLVLDAGHAEYLPPHLTATELAEVWTPPDELTADELAGYYDPTDEQWTERTGLAADRRPDAVDLSWCRVVRITTTYPRARAALAGLAADLLAPGTPSGDDDCFDYWPSGCRLALALAAELDALDAYAELVAGITDRITALGYPELYGSCGVEDPTERTPE